MLSQSLANCSIFIHKKCWYSCTDKEISEGARPSRSGIDDTYQAIGMCTLLVKSYHIAWKIQVGHIIRGLSSDGRALALHARGRGIDALSLQPF